MYTYIIQINMPYTYYFILYFIILYYIILYHIILYYIILYILICVRYLHVYICICIHIYIYIVILATESPSKHVKSLKTSLFHRRIRPPSARASPSPTSPTHCRRRRRRPVRTPWKARAGKQRGKQPEKWEFLREKRVFYGHKWASLGQRCGFWWSKMMTTLEYSDDYCRSLPFGIPQALEMAEMNTSAASGIAGSVRVVGFECRFILPKGGPIKLLVGGLVAIFYFPRNIGFLVLVIPIDELIFFRGVAQPPTRLPCSILNSQFLMVKCSSLVQ